MSTSGSNCKEGASKSSKDGVCEMVGKLQNMSTVDTALCANCGKEGANNTCNKCKVATYCNAVCKKVHKKKHKKECEEHIRLAAEKHNEELRITVELHDKELFKLPPPKEDCPICFICLPSLASGRVYTACCGKEICSGCAHAPVFDDQGNEVDIDKQNECAFCRTLAPRTDDESIKRLNKRMEAKDPLAIHNLGYFYNEGLRGLPQDRTKGLELLHRAGELGYSQAYTSIGFAYHYGEGVAVDKKKANHYYELAAMRGCEAARHSLGRMELQAGNTNRALKHHSIAVRGGCNGSLRIIKKLYSDGNATKDDYTTALQLYQAYLGEIKSKQRDEAAAADEDFRYY